MARSSVRAPSEVDALFDALIGAAPIRLALGAALRAAGAFTDQVLALDSLAEPLARLIGRNPGEDFEIAWTIGAIAAAADRWTRAPRFSASVRIMGVDDAWLCADGFAGDAAGPLARQRAQVTALGPELAARRRATFVIAAPARDRDRLLDQALAQAGDGVSGLWVINAGAVSAEALAASLRARGGTARIFGGGGDRDLVWMRDRAAMERIDLGFAETAAAQAREAWRGWVERCFAQPLNEATAPIVRARLAAGSVSPDGDVALMERAARFAGLYGGDDLGEAASAFAAPRVMMPARSAWLAQECWGPEQDNFAAWRWLGPASETNIVVRLPWPGLWRLRAPIVGSPLSEDELGLARAFLDGVEVGGYAPGERRIEGRFRLSAQRCWEGLDLVIAFPRGRRPEGGEPRTLTAALTALEFERESD